MRRVVLSGVIMSMLAGVVGCGGQQTIEVTEVDSVSYEKGIRDAAYEVLAYEKNGRLAGQEEDEALAKHIERKIQERGVEVKKAVVELDRWQPENVEITLECDCSKEGVYTLREIGMYPMEINDTSVVEMVDIGRGEKADIEGKEIKGKYVLIDRDSEKSISELEEEMLTKGVRGVVTGSGLEEYARLDIEEGMPTAIPILVTTDERIRFLRSNMPEGRTEITLNLKGTIEEKQQSTMVWGEIPGRSRDIIYVTMSRDTLFSSFMGKGVGFAEYFELIGRMKETGYKPRHTLRFLVTTGQEWGKVDGGRNEGLKALLETRSDWVAKAKAVVVLEGSRPYEEGINKSVSVTEGLKERVESYNEVFYAGQNLYGYKVDVLGIDEITKVTEAEVWKEKGVEVVVQNIDKSSAYYVRDRSTGDKMTLSIDTISSNHNIDYYMGLIKELDKGL